MSEGFERLKSLGVQKIHEDTHIALQHISSMLNEDFSSLTRVQFLGFVSILEREYGIDLEEYKANSLLLIKEHKAYQSSESHLFVVPKKQRNYTPIYVSVVVVIFAVVAYMNIDLTPLNESVQLQENEVIQEAKAEVKKKIEKREEDKKEEVVAQKEQVVESEKNTTSTQINSQQIEQKNVLDVAKTEKKIEKHQANVKKQKAKRYLTEQELFIQPKSKVWLGYINVKTGKKSSTIVKSPFYLDLKGKYLLMFGHGHVEIAIGEQVYRFNKSSTLRLLYNKGALKKITSREFRALNRGKKW